MIGRKMQDFKAIPATKVYPSLFANKITSVQPLLGPTGLIYYLKYRYASNKGCQTPEPIPPVQPPKVSKYRSIDDDWTPSW
jgi:hypothetical protein